MWMGCFIQIRCIFWYGIKRILLYKMDIKWYRQVQSSFEIMCFAGWAQPIRTELQFTTCLTVWVWAWDLGFKLSAQSISSQYNAENRCEQSRNVRTLFNQISLNTTENPSLPSKLIVRNIRVFYYYYFYLCVYVNYICWDISFVILVLVTTVPADVLVPKGHQAIGRYSAGC